jgi:YidC/Oxa1 family membrane protein insertase
MQEVQPKIAALREKYKNDRQTLSQEMMKLQKEEGFNPLGGCLPILLQAPVFLALFHVLRLIGTPKAGALATEYGWSTEQVISAGRATVFGAPIASAFNDPRNLVGQIAGASPTATKIVAGVLVVLMVAATYITQRQIISRNTQVVDGQQAMIQKLLLYGMPASLLVSGFFFPIGVLFYWFTNNLWTMGQQFYILKRMPHPNAKKDDDRPSVDGKLLAPKPGQKPVRPPRGRAAASAPATPAGIGSPDAAPPDGEVTDPADGKPAGRTGRAGKGARTASAGDDAAAAASGDRSAASPDGAGPAAGSAAGVPGGTGAGGGGANGRSAGTGGATADAAGGADAAEAADGAGGSTPAPRGSKPTGAGGSRPGGGRRPQGQRSPPQTRQKKKRR